MKFYNIKLSFSNFAKVDVLRQKNNFEFCEIRDFMEKVMKVRFKVLIKRQKDNSQIYIQKLPFFWEIF